MTCHGIPKSDLGSTGVTNQEFSASANLGTKAPRAPKNQKPINSFELSKALKSSVNEYFTVDVENKQRTLDLANAQRDKPLKDGSANAIAREQVHTTGTSQMKVRRRNGQRWKNQKKASGPDVRDAKLARREKEIPNELKFEGWFDFTLKHVVSMDSDTFTAVVGGIIDTVRSKINNQKSLMEQVLGVDSGTFMRYLLTAACAVATGVFAYQSVSAASWVPLVFAGLTACIGMYAMQEELFGYAKTVLREYLIKTYGPKLPLKPEASQEEQDDIIAKFMSGEKIIRDEEEEESDESETKHESGAWLLRTGFVILADVLQALLVGGVGFAVMGRKDRFVENLSKIPRISSGISALIELIMKWMADIIDRIVGSDLKSYFGGNQDLDTWAREVMETADLQDAGELELCPSTASRVQRLLQVGRELAVNKSITTSLGIQVHRSAMRELEKLHVIHNKSGLGKEAKPEPIGVLMMGESGVGKSFTTQRLMKFLGVRLMPKGRREAFLEDFNSEVWPCCNEDEYASGYKGQFFTVIDDLGQHVPAKGAKSDELTVIRMINSNPVRLNMAALHEKGNVVFSSEMIFGSTNQKSFWQGNIVQPEAFLRRWSSIVIMAPKKEWCTQETQEGPLSGRRLDHARLLDGFDKNVAEFHLQKITDMAQQTFTTTEVMDFETFEDYLVELYMAKRKAHDKVISSIQKEANERLQKIYEEEEMAEPVSYECGFESEEDIERRKKVEELEKQLRELNGTRHMSWAQWMLHTNLITKTQSVYNAAKTAYQQRIVRPVRRKIRTLRDLVAEFKWQVHRQWVLFNRMELHEKFMLLSIFSLLAIMFQACVMPYISAALATASSLIPSGGKKKKRKGGRGRSEEINDDIDGLKVLTNREYIDTLERFIEISQADAVVRLVRNGHTPQPNPESVEALKKFLIKRALKSPTREVQQDIRCFGTPRTIVYKLEPKYQSVLFAAPEAYSEYATRYVGGLFRRNVYHMYRGDASMDAPSGGKVTIIKGALMLINKHFIHEIRAAALNDTTGAKTLKFVPHAQPLKAIHVPYQHFADPANVSGMDSTQDAVLVNCEQYMGSHRDIMSKFVSHADSEKLRDHEFTVYAPPGPNHMKQHDVLGSFADSIQIAGNRHEGMFWYTAPTQDGDCGGLVIESRDRDPCARIVGIHAAGERRQSNSKLAFAQRVSREYLEELAAKWESALDSRPVDAELAYEQSLFMNLDVVRKDTKYNMLSTDSDLVPSFMHGWRGDPTRVPARLAPFTNSAGEFKVPLQIALEGEFSNNTPLDEAMLQACSHHLAKSLMPYMKRRGRLLTVEEAIVGLPHSPLKPLQRNTSAGYYGLHNPDIKPQKKGAFGTMGDYTLDTPAAKRLIAKVEADWEQMKTGKPVDAPYLLFMKQEKRSLAKVEAGKARLVKAASVDDAINMRRVYGCVVADIMEHHTLCGIAVGINPLSADWGNAAKHVQRKGPDLIAGDFGSFDATQTRQLLMTIMRTISVCAGHTDPSIKRIEQCIAETIASPRCMIGDLVYQNDRGMPSGNVMTSIINSLTVQLLLRLAWLLIMKEQDETHTQCLKRFDEHVIVLAYGDDHLINVSEEAVVRYNQTSLIAVFPTIGMKYTSDDKEDTNPPPSRTLDQVTFLKRSFRQEERLGMIVGPLDEQTLCEVCYYTNRKGSPNAVTRDNVERTFRELALHGEKRYEELSQLLEAEHNKRSQTPVVRPPFEIALAEVMGELPGFDPNAV